MKQLTPQSTRTFCRLLKKLRGKQQITLYSEGFMPLIIERKEEKIYTFAGVGINYCLRQSYRQNEGTIVTPQMAFLVVDNRKDEKDMKAIHIYPMVYMEDDGDIYEESILTENGQITSFIKAWQDGHCSYANHWLKNIRQQGFLK